MLLLCHPLDLWIRKQHCCQAAFRNRALQQLLPERSSSHWLGRGSQKLLRTSCRHRTSVARWRDVDSSTKILELSESLTLFQPNFYLCIPCHPLSPRQVSWSLISQGWVNSCWPKEQEQIIVTGCWYRYTNLCPGRIECSQQLKAADCSLTSIKRFTASPEPSQGHRWERSQPAIGKHSSLLSMRNYVLPTKLIPFPGDPRNNSDLALIMQTVSMFVCPGFADPSNEPWELKRVFWYNYRKCIHWSLWAVGSRTCPVWEDFSFICAFLTLAFDCFNTEKTPSRYPVYLQIICPPLLKYHCTAP